MTEKQFCLICGVLFSIVALVHMYRLVAGWPVMLGSWDVPVWMSGFAVVLAGVLGCYGLQFGTRK